MSASLIFSIKQTTFLSQMGVKVMDAKEDAEEDGHGKEDQETTEGKEQSAGKVQLESS